MIQLLGLLQAGKGRNADELSRACEVSRRTIFRDLDTLRNAGVPLLFDDEQNAYRIPATFFLPPTNFTTEEALAVIVLCYEMGDRQLPFYEAAQNAALKLEASLPVRVREQLQDLSSAVQIKLEPSNPLAGHTPVYRQLLSAIARRQPVRIEYDSYSDNELMRIKLSPYRMLFSRRSWYVIGRSSLHREVRTFNVGRIHALELIDDQFDIPRGFSIQRYLGNAWHLIPDGPDTEVVVRFSPLVARNVAEVAWHRTQRLHWNDNGTLDFRVCVAGIREISWWILGYGDQAQVLEPEPLRQIIIEHARGLLRRYHATA